MKVRAHALPSLIRHHVRGDFSLLVSFWLGWLLITELLRRTLFRGAKLIGETWALDFKSQCALQALLYASAAFIFLLGACGAWRSASKTLQHPDQWLKRNAVKLCILGLVCAFASAATEASGPYAPLVRTAQMAFGSMPAEFPSVQLRSDGHEVWLSGRLGRGSAALVANTLRRAPAAKVLVLRSGGGSISDALAIAKLVEQRGLSTIADKQCSSSCVLILLAGKERLAVAGARIGFHQASEFGPPSSVPAGTTRSEKPIANAA